MKMTEIRTTAMDHKCQVCGENITPQMARAHFERYKTDPFRSCGVYHRSRMAWRVSGWSHLNCEEARLAAHKETREWSGSADPADPDNYWIDDETGERVNAHTGERTAQEARQ